MLAASHLVFGGTSPEKKGGHESLSQPLYVLPLDAFQCIYYSLNKIQDVVQSYSNGFYNQMLFHVGWLQDQPQVDLHIGY